MPKPAARTLTLTQPSPPSSAPAPLKPAYDNGVPYAERGTELRPAPITGKPTPAGDATDEGTTKRPALKRRGKQIAVRIPEDLYARLQACMDGTRYPQNRLVERALDAELKQHGY